MIKKVLVIGIIFLFIGTSIVPAKTTNKTEIKTNYNDEICNNLFDRYMKLLMKIGHMPSMAVCAIKEEKVVFSKAYGFYDLETNKKATEETIYLVHSVSKTVSATALMQLYDQNLFNLDDDINDFLNFSVRNPKYPSVPITFRMLLAHQSSLTDFICHKIPGDPDIPEYPYPYLKEYLLQNGKHFSPNVWSDNAPGEAYEYSNIGYGLIGYLIERLTGKPLNDYCKENIFEPLDMHNSSFRLSDFNISNVAVPYMYCPVIYQKNKINREIHYGCLPYAAGNLRTTITDLSHFLISHMNGGVFNGVRILNESTVEMMHTVQYPDSFQGRNKLPYCLGFFVKKTLSGDERIGHTGFFTAKIYLNHKDDTGIIILTNVAAWPMSIPWWPSIGRSIVTSNVMDKAKDFVENALFWRAKHS
jgi:CubicO group peptidase (beta-lactamase class C family)